MTIEHPFTDADAIRRRPGMYIGDVADGRGLAHLIWELVANSLDQHLAGRCSRIDVVLQHDGSALVEDDGPGIPLVDVDGRPFAEVALTRFHATPTFDGHAPHEHVGLWGVGMFVVNALSSRLTLDVRRDGFHHTQRFERGFAVSRLEKVGPSTRTGTGISIQPDPAIFSDPWFNAGAIAARLRELAWLLPTLTLSFQDRREHVFREPRGLVVFLERTRRGLVPIENALFVEQIVGEIRVEAAVEWLPCNWSTVESYANIERTTDGGTHVQGLVEGLAEGLRDALPTWKARPKKKATEAVNRGLHAIVCVRLHEPIYGEPTKSRLTTPEAKRAVSSAVRGAFAAFVRCNASLLGHFTGDS
ncbi:ATP-binding protein [Sorangium sp. So ce726]|uniref:ATP-binding protein n=1 Tax=Sorangium sp. So ce726 TaxID=3133319 RepID=UPI003F5FFF3E